MAGNLRMKRFGCRLKKAKASTVRIIYQRQSELGRGERGGNQLSIRDGTTGQILVFAQKTDDCRFGQCAN